MIKNILMVILVVVVLGALLPVVLPMFFDTTADIEAIAGSEPELIMLQELWPLALMIIIIGLAAGLIFYALRKFNVIGN